MSKELGIILRRLRESNSFTQKQVATPLRVDRSTYSNYERGVTEPDLETLCKLAKIFNVETSVLLPDGNNVDIVADSGDLNVFSLNNDEKQLVSLFRNMSTEEKESFLAEADKYKK